MLTHLPELKACVETEWLSHISDDFCWLSSIPSGVVAANAQIFRSHPSQYDISFLLRRSQWALNTEEKAALWNEYLKEKKENYYRYSPIADWKPGLKYQMDNGEWSAQEREQAENFWRKIADIDTPKANEIRKELKPLLNSEFNTKLTSQQGGIWVAPLSVNGIPLSLVFDFGGFSRGFRYEFWLPLKRPGSSRTSLSYESALGFNMPPWDLLRTNALPEQLGLTVEAIKKVLAWLAVVDWSTKQLDSH